jgi:hypothetical protein
MHAAAAAAAARHRVALGARRTAPTGSHDKDVAARSALHEAAEAAGLLLLGRLCYSYFLTFLALANTLDAANPCNFSFSRLRRLFHNTGDSLNL